jgi:hypothetical protein
MGMSNELFLCGQLNIYQLCMGFSSMDQLKEQKLIKKYQISFS